MSSSGQAQRLPKRMVVLVSFAAKMGQVEMSEGMTPEKSFRSSLRSTRLVR